MNTPVLIEYEAAGGPRLQPGSINVAGVRTRMPQYQTLAYLEKVGTVSLLAIALVYLLVRTVHAGPMTAIAEVGGKRI